MFKNIHYKMGNTVSVFTKVTVTFLQGDWWFPYSI